MKLIYISHWRFPSDKTMSPLIMRTCAEFARQGVDVELWVPRRVNKQYRGVDPFDHYDLERNFKIKKLLVIDLMSSIGGGLSFVLMTSTYALSLWWKSRSVSKDVIWYAHDPRDVFFLKNKNVFVEIHDFYKSSAEWLNSIAFARALGLIVTNKIKMKSIYKDFNFPEGRMLHAPNAVDVKKFNRKETRKEAREILSLPLDKKLVIYTGSLFGWKGIHTLADASSYIHEDTNIIFAGGNEKEQVEFKSYIDDNNLKNILLLPLPYEDVEKAPLLMRAADVLVLPNTARDKASKYETSPVKLFEYMASGTPIIASDLPSVRGIVDESSVSFFKPDDPKSLAEVVSGVLSSESISKERSRHAQNIVQEYSWDKRISKVKKFIESRM